ncbi:Sugar phosphatase YidA [Paraliobacillus sp. PM-2]|uniref:Cof-type HAD-IIB family hydrolase n=1 Tax=Paraliobacillus sp. PM-2 TaxID=1462524 RepID=UPI00061C6A65|nr:Cof-type HAD-IIB family hydrolase [Paraliobacillus sp. PM-2]CQR47289.1 Sugar phosphatase YidA [Paraliobacillus sp. PM-2]
MEKMDIRLIALDMDGTVLHTDHTVSKENEQAIKRAIEKGIEVVFATGRHYSTCCNYASTLGVKYLITVNGAEIWSTDGELLDRNPLPIEALNKYQQIHQAYSPWTWLVSTDKVWRNEQPQNFNEYTWLKYGFDIKESIDRDEIIEELSSETDIELSNSSPTNIEVNAMGINKARAIEKLCKKLDIKMNQVMAMGDSLNDIKMIEEAGLGIAMENAQDEVKKVADWVTTHHTKDGVAQAINKWLMK